MISLISHNSKASFYQDKIYVSKHGRTKKSNKSKLDQLFQNQVHPNSYPIKINGEQVALAAPIRLKDNSVAYLTKASELTPNYPIYLQSDTASYEAHHIGTLKEHDLAILKTNQYQPSSSFQLTENSYPDKRGTWLVSMLPQQKKSLGTIGTNLQNIPMAGAALGIRLSDRNNYKGALVEEIYPNTSASSAELKVGDIITKIDNRTIKNSPILIHEINKRTPGDTITLTISRMETKLTKDLIIGDQSAFEDHREKVHLVSGKLSRRKTGFKSILQHDAPILWNQMGSPCLDLQGNFRGINIAKVNRLTTYVLPVDAFTKDIHRFLNHE